MPIEPVHQAQHPDDGEEIDEYAQSRGGREALNSLNVVGNGAEQDARLMAVVISQRKALQMVVGAHPQVVRHPLAYTLGVIVIDVGREGSDFHLARAHPTSQRSYKVIEPAGKMMRSDNIVENDFQRPGASQTHQGLDRHGDQYEEESSAIRANELANQPRHTASLVAIGRVCKFGFLPWKAWLICFRSCVAGIRSGHSSDIRCVRVTQLRIAAVSAKYNAKCPPSLARFEGEVSSGACVQFEIKCERTRCDRGRAGISEGTGGEQVI